MPFIFDGNAFNSEASTNGFSTAGANNFSSLRYEIDIGDTGTRGWGSRTDIALSPNGRYLVFSEFDRPLLHL